MQVTTTHTRWKRRPHTHTMQVKSTHTHTHNASENHTHTHTSAGMQQLLPNGHLKAAQQRSTGRLRANKEPSCSFGQLHLGACSVGVISNRDLGLISPGFSKALA
ncbi:hypothetical protein PMIN03_006172 [Paraphaeosphaeria minitans]